MFFLASLIGFFVPSRSAIAADVPLQQQIAQSHARWAAAHAAVLQLAANPAASESCLRAEAAREQAGVEYRQLIARLMR